jgi:type III secretory pathway component EscS
MTKRLRIKQRNQNIKNLVVFLISALPVIGLAAVYGQIIANGGF